MGVMAIKIDSHAPHRTFLPEHKDARLNRTQIASFRAQDRNRTLGLARGEAGAPTGDAQHSADRNPEPGGMDRRSSDLEVVSRYARPRSFAKHLGMIVPRPWLRLHKLGGLRYLSGFFPSLLVLAARLVGLYSSLRQGVLNVFHSITPFLFFGA